MTDDLRAVATPLLPCPFCGALLDGHEHSAFHPENECWLGKDVNGWELDEWSYVQWNRRALLARPVEQNAKIDFAWLIENVRHTTYWDGRGTGRSATYVRDANEAVRFARKEDAERVAGWVLENEPVVAREHGWLARPIDEPIEKSDAQMYRERAELLQVLLFRADPSQRYEWVGQELDASIKKIDAMPDWTKGRPVDEPQRCTYCGDLFDVLAHRFCAATVACSHNHHTFNFPFGMPPNFMFSSPIVPSADTPTTADGALPICSPSVCNIIAHISVRAATGACPPAPTNERVERLRAVINPLIEFGGHLDYCQTWRFPERKCDCGRDQAVSDARKFIIEELSK